jgi:outer membrane receptor protein involved in Fe transport
VIKAFIRGTLLEHRKGRGALLIAGAALVAPVPAALAADEGAASGLEEVIVTASRRSETLQDTALSVSVRSPEEFAVGGLTSLSDVLDYTPGAIFSGGSAPTDNTISMRGVSTLTSSPTVGVYIDDVPIGSGNGQAAGASLMLDVMKAGMERVEVVKGPQGTSFGASSMGGIVRYISGDPSLSELGGTLGADFSTTEHGGSNQRYTGRLNAPLVADKVGLRLSGYYEDVGGFIDRIPQAASGAAKDVDGWENMGGMMKLSGNVNDRFNVSLLALYDETTFNGRNIVALNGGPPFVPANGPYETDTSYSDDKSEFWVTGLTLNYDLGYADFVSSTSYQEREVTSTTDLVADFGALLRLFCGCTVDNAPFTGTQTTDRFVQEFRMVSKTADRNAGDLEWTVGAIYSNEESGNGQRLAGQPTNYVLLDVNIPSELTEFATFGNLTYFISPQFDLSVGVRLADVDASVAVDDGPEILIRDTPPVEVSDMVDTYSFAARYRPSDTLSLYGRIASGYRPAAANLPVRDTSGNNVASPIIETDSLWSYELGAKGFVADGKLSYDVTGWYLNWKDLQARVFVNGVMTGGNADSDVTAYGLEGSLAYSPIDDLVIRASAAYTDSTLDDDETSAFGAVSGENMPGIPEWSAALRADYSLPLSGETEVTLGGGVRYIGDRDTGFEGGTGSNGQTITPRIYNFVMEAHTVTDLSVAIKHGRFGGSLYATNVFDEYAYSGGSARPAAGFIRATASVIQPRTIGATFTVDF